MMAPASAAPRALNSRTLLVGAQALAARDPDLARLVRTQGPPPLWGRRPGFATLFRIILEQQVSLAAARTMYQRVRRQLGAVTPATIAAIDVAGLRQLGLTRQKAGYSHGLALGVLDGRIDLTAIARAPDELGQRRLLEVPGLGPWSVAIYYLMALRRPDVWPPGDLALADALRRVKRLRAAPGATAQQRLARRWAPWRSVAARLLWDYYLGTPRRARP
jgi:DNA-3-methyladenine glycosylase II